MNLTSSPKRILLAAGGSGGHLYPALALAQQLQQQSTPPEILFAAAGLEKNPFLAGHSYPFQSVHGASLDLRAPWRLPGACYSICRGYYQSCKILKDYRPNLVVGFGSYHTFPMLLAARSQGYPIVLHEQNSHPGKVIRYFSDTALFTGVYFPSASAMLSGKTLEMAMPLRDGYKLENISRRQAYDYFGLQENKLTLLVFGGSQGAKFINEKLPSVLIRILKARDDVQILHFTGDENLANVLSERYHQASIPSAVKPFEKCMELAWRAADVCVTRAGACTIAELLEFEIPAFLIPYPFAADNHQESNADFVVNKVGGGWKMRESDFDANLFSAQFENMLSHNGLLLHRNNISKFKANSKRKEFVNAITDLLNS